jgi:hypothetical protein
MKKANWFFLTIAGLSLALHSGAQGRAGTDSTGLPGDNFSLQGALALFQRAGSPEDFEKLLNTQDNHVNNLDLNGDGEADYIRVIDHADKNAHALVLQAVVSEKENQDIAVIELEKTGDTSAIVQIIGDEDIYGEEVIVEPGEGEEEGSDDEAAIFYHSSPATHGPSNHGYDAGAQRIVVNVWYWPSVRFLYAPGYRPWISPWRWRAYPGWWRPWRPLAWHAWRPFRGSFHRHFAIVRTHRVLHAHRIYRPLRVSSVSVRTRHAAAVGNYRVSRHKTTVTGPRGHKATRTTTTVRGRGGKVKARKTTIRRR